MKFHLCKYGFDSSGKGSILPLKQTNSFAFAFYFIWTMWWITVRELSNMGSN